ncbi:MAG: hypothetical protein AAGC60_22795 [Acidobacteriota bacterium]
MPDRPPHRRVATALARFVETPVDRALVGLLALLALAIPLRLVGLSAVDLRGDEVTYFLDVRDRIDLGDYAARHFRTFGSDRQMPLPRVLGAATVRALERVAGTPVDARSVRLAFAWAGIATVVAFWLLGRRLALGLGAAPGPPALLTGLLVTVNPYHLYWSRTAHIYVFPMLFLGLAAACAVGWLHALAEERDRTRAGRAWLAGVTASTVLASYAHMSAWIASSLLWALLVGVWILRRRDKLGPWRRPFSRCAWTTTPQPRALLAALALWAASLAPWAWLFVRALARAAYDPVWDDLSNPLNRFTALWRLPFLMTWGGGWRSLLTLGLPLAALVLGWRHPRWRRPVRVAALGGLALFILLALAQSGGFFAFRYFVPLWPLLILLSTLGLLLLGERLRRLTPRPLPEGVPALALGALLALAMAPALRDLHALRGNPVELSRIAAVLDETFADDTPVLVNGMNVVRFELEPYRPERVIPTFTVVDIGLNLWEANDWRGSAEDFLQRFPDAPLVQQGRNYYEHPSIGPWDYPERYFTQQLELRNEPALRLRQRLLGASIDFYTSAVENSRAITRISYNRREDVLARARAEGRDLLALFGDGWSYRKLDDLSDWRALEERATLAVHNLSERPMRARLVVRIFTPGGRKQVQARSLAAGSRPDDAPPVDAVLIDTVLAALDEPVDWTIELTLPPGESEVELVDPLFGFGRVPLLVWQVDIEEITS